MRADATELFQSRQVNAELWQTDLIRVQFAIANVANATVAMRRGIGIVGDWLGLFVYAVIVLALFGTSIYGVRAATLLSRGVCTYLRGVGAARTVSYGTRATRAMALRVKCIAKAGGRF